MFHFDEIATEDKLLKGHCLKSRKTFFESNLCWELGHHKKFTSVLRPQNQKKIFATQKIAEMQKQK